jgi:transposase
MITPEIKAEIRRLVLRDGLSVCSVARRLGVHHATARRALRSDDEQATDRTSTPSALDAFKPYVVDRLLELPELSCVRLLEELRAKGYAQGVAILRRYVAKVRAPRRRKAYLHVEVDPGQQAQVDWGSFGHLRVGSAQRPLSVFSMVLSWSRAIFIDFSLDQRMDTFLRMHRRALEFFGGVPRSILYDNLKSVVLHHVGTTVQFNPRFLAFAGHYLFEPVAAPVRYPEAKGRVESSIRFIRQSFFYGRSFATLDDLRAQAAAWRDQTANQRIHATTRERPADRLVVERSRLRPLPERAYDTDLVVFPLIVSKDARVRLDSNSYSVPPDHVGKTVVLRGDDHRVRVLCEGVEIASHVRCWDRRRAVEDRAHIEQLLARRPAARGPKRKERLASLAPECRSYLQEIARRHIDLESEVQKLLRLVDKYGDTEVAQGMTSALAQRTFGARYVHALIDQARFARGLTEPLDPVLTGNPTADNLVVDPHPLESYDALFEQAKACRPAPRLDSGQGSANPLAERRP